MEVTEHLARSGSRSGKAAAACWTKHRVYAAAAARFERMDIAYMRTANLLCPLPCFVRNISIYATAASIDVHLRYVDPTVEKCITRSDSRRIYLKPLRYQGLFVKSLMSTFTFFVLCFLFYVGVQQLFFEYVFVFVITSKC